MGAGKARHARGQKKFGAVTGAGKNSDWGYPTPLPCVLALQIRILSSFYRCHNATVQARFVTCIVSLRHCDIVCLL